MKKFIGFLIILQSACLVFEAVFDTWGWTALAAFNVMTLSFFYANWDKWYANK